MKKTSVSLSGIGALLLSLNVAHAGETLHFRQGNVKTPDMKGSTQWLSQNLIETSYYVVQFRTVIQNSDQEFLKNSGVRILRYVPDDALLVQTTAPVVQQLVRASDRVRAVVPYMPKWRLSPSFGAVSVFNAQEAEAVSVRVLPQQDVAQVAAAMQNIEGVSDVVVAGRSLTLQTTLAALENIAAVEGVEWVQPVAQMEPLHIELLGKNEARKTASGDYTDLNGYESGTKIMNFDAAWKRGYTGEGQIVSMADTGLDSGDLGKLSSDFQGQVKSGFVFGLFSKTWEDEMGHGTHVAGSVLSAGTASSGALKGGAYKAKMVAQGMWSPMLGNLTVPQKLADLFTKAYSEGARVHTNSWGSPRDLGSYDTYAQQVDEYMFANPEMLVVFAAGNSGEDKNKDGRIDPGSVSSPGTAKNVLTVGASENQVSSGGIQKKLSELRDGMTKWGVEPLASDTLSNNSDGIAVFSSRGPTKDGRLKPEVVAPGTNILSNRSSNPKAEPLWGVYNKEYVWSGGTSMATPLTAGAAVVVREYLVKTHKIANPSAALVKGALIHTAKDLFPGQYGEIGKARGQELLAHRPDGNQGYGRVDMASATDLSAALLVDERKGVGQGEGQAYEVKVAQAGQLTATLVYTDAPATAASAKALVNDLDAVLVRPDGTTVTLNDHTNNYEMLEEKVQPGTYQVKIVGKNVPQGISGKQPYALLVSVK